MTRLSISKDTRSSKESKQELKHSSSNISNNELSLLPLLEDSGACARVDATSSNSTERQPEDDNAPWKAVPVVVAALWPRTGAFKCVNSWQHKDFQELSERLAMKESSNSCVTSSNSCISSSNSCIGGSPERKKSSFSCMTCSVEKRKENICMALDPTSKLLLLGGRRKVEIYEVATSRLLFTLEGHKKMLTGCVVSSDGNSAITCTEGKQLRVWSLTGTNCGKCTRKFRHESSCVDNMALSRDGSTLATCVGGLVTLWDVTLDHEMDPSTNQPLGGSLNLSIRTTLKSKHSDRNAVSVVFDSLGKTLVTGHADGEICMWNVCHGTVRSVFRGHTGEVSCLSFSPDDRYLVSAGEDCVRVWNLSPVGMQVAVLANADRFAHITSNGCTLFARSSTLSQNQLVLWDFREIRRSMEAGKSSSFSEPQDLQGNGSWDAAAQRELEACKPLLTQRLPSAFGKCPLFFMKDLTAKELCVDSGELLGMLMAPHDESLFTVDANCQIMHWCPT